jgi:hypothetical protein
MRFGRIAALSLALVVLPLAGAFARGAGGFTWGQQYFDPGLSNADLGASTTGVFGYNVTWGGQRYGGFAMAIHADALDGGFVGAIAGQEFRMGPFTTAMTLWTGFGGTNVTPLYTLPGTFALFGELSFEAGFGFLPGVMVTGYAGMQVMAAVLPDQAIISNAVYTPVLGVRIAWGS